MLDPSSRPAPRLVPLLRVLADHDVDWVLTGSTVLAAYGADLTPSDLDVTPALDSRNLRRLAAVLRTLAAVPAYTPGWRADFTIESCRSWRPRPATEAQLEYLFVTRLGMLDVPLRMCGSYEELLPAASRVEIGGIPVQVCDPREVLTRVTTLTSPKHQARAAVYAAVADGLPVQSDPAAVARLVTRLP